LPINWNFGSSQGRFAVSQASCSGCRLKKWAQTFGLLGQLDEHFPGVV
jgi:hypothetical protein